MLKFKSKETNIFYTSDPHYDHKNICRGISSWNDKSGTRDFDTLEDMNATIVRGINSYVGADDILFMLGDVSFNGIQNLWNFRKKIICKNIYLITGNHDHHIIDNKILYNVLIDREGNLIDIPFEKDSYYIKYLPVTAQRLFKRVEDFQLISVDGKLMVLFHRPMMSWDKMNKGSIHLFGHVHGSELPVKLDNMLDVGMDNAYKLFGEYRVFSHKEVLNIINKK